MPLIPTTDGRVVSIGKLLCVARNYPAHASEMGLEVPKKPVFFLKPSSALLRDGGTIVLPRESKQVEAEIELAVVLGRRGRRIEPHQAMSYVLGYAIFLDMTARDLQAVARKEGSPWTVCKGFDTFAPMSSITPKQAIRDPHNLLMSLKINGAEVQRANTGDMVFKIHELIGNASSVMSLDPGDVIATGTPSGVHKVQDGDSLEATIEGLGILRNRVRAEA